jgi:hypothetical protein
LAACWPLRALLRLALFVPAVLAAVVALRGDGGWTLVLYILFGYAAATLPVRLLARVVPRGAGIAAAARCRITDDRGDRKTRIVRPRRRPAHPRRFPRSARLASGRWTATRRLNARGVPMRCSARTPAQPARTRRAVIGVAAVCLAVTTLTGCGGASDRADGESTAPAGAPAASVTGSDPARPQTGGGGGGYCDVFRDQGGKLLLLTKVTTETDPAKVKADFDTVVAVYQALADAAPPELRADAQLLLKTYQDDREAIARAGWTPRAVLNTLADDLNDDKYVAAAGHQMTYVNDVCKIDPANPAPTS